MLLRQCKIKNLGSYRRLEFDFSGIGLSSLFGPTGSGKSTFCDAPCWIMFGKDSKDSKVDDVKSWNTDEPTEGSQVVELSTKTITIHRKRGHPTENDLYFTDSESEKKIRGKDATETQKLINETLGINYDLYLMASYFHEFSEVGRFFTAEASERRKILEKVGDLSMPVALAEASSDRRKHLKKDIVDKEKNLSKVHGKLEQVEESLKKHQESSSKWETDRTSKLEELQEKHETFASEVALEKEKIINRLKYLEQTIQMPEEFDGRTAQIKSQLTTLESLRPVKEEVTSELSEVEYKIKSIDDSILKLDGIHGPNCPTCNQQVDRDTISANIDALVVELYGYERERKALDERHEELKSALSAEPKLRKGLEKIQEEKQHNEKLIEKYSADEVLLLITSNQKSPYIQQLSELKQQVNPFAESLSALTTTSYDTSLDLSRSAAEIVKENHLLSSINWLYDASFILRSNLLESAIHSIEKSTNSYFEKYFESLLRVKFTLQNTDKLEVIITINGNKCPYERLSKGQRCLLKLAFWLSLRKAAENKSGIKLLNAMFDESLDGLDGNLKHAAFRMLQDIESEYKSILLIDHSETLQNEFDNRYRVSLVGEESIIERVGEKT